MSPLIPLGLSLCPDRSLRFRRAEFGNWLPLFNWQVRTPNLERIHMNSNVFFALNVFFCLFCFSLKYTQFKNLNLKLLTYHSLQKEMEKNFKVVLVHTECRYINSHHHHRSATNYWLFSMNFISFSFLTIYLFWKMTWSSFGLSLFSRSLE